jgi:molecular chaperone GrpE
MTEQDAPEEVDGDIDIEEPPEAVDTDDIDLDEGPDADLVERVAESEPEDIAEELAALRARTESLESELDEREAEADELEEKLKRKQAEFQNYKKRMKERREEEQQRATEDLVSRILDVRDNLERALGQDADTDIRGGVESTLRQLDDVLQAENVDVVDPDPGEDVDPTVHQVLANVESDQPAGTIAEVHRPGYEMAGKVLREAQVTVSEADE